MAEAWPESLPGDAPRQAVYRTMRQLRPPEVDELVEEYKTGVSTVYDLAARFSIHRATVGKHLRDRGIDTTPRALQPGDVPAAAKLYQAGWTLAKIARHYKVGNDTVWRHLLAIGVVIRPRGRRRLPSTG